MNAVILSVAKSFARESLGGVEGSLSAPQKQEPVGFDLLASPEDGSTLSPGCRLLQQPLDQVQSHLFRIFARDRHIQVAALDQKT